MTTYRRGLEMFGFTDRTFDEYGWLIGTLPIVQEIELNSLNCIHIGQSEGGICAVTVSWDYLDAVGGSRIGNYVVCKKLKEIKRQYLEPKQLSLFRSYTIFAL